MTRYLMAAIVTVWLGSAAGLGAHHSLIAEYDPAKPVTIEGTLVHVQWTNPHIWIYLEVKDANGAVTRWGFTGAPPGLLQRRGFTKAMMKYGSVIKVEGFRARDGSPNASAGNVTFADGRKVFVAPDEAPKASDAK